MAFKFNEYHLGGAGGVIEPITIKQNGTYNATDGVDGYAPITVDVAGSGTGGGDNTVIDVAELPTENVDDSKIYRVAQEDVSVYMYAPDSMGAEGEFSVVMSTKTQATVSARYILVDELPENMEETTVTAGVYNFVVYIVRDEWEPKICYRGQIMPLSNVAGLPAVGTISDPSECEGEGLYILLNNVTSYGIPNSNNNRGIYQYTTEWENVSEKLAQVSTLEMQVDGLKSQVEEKNQKIRELEGYEVFSKYAGVEYLDSVGMTFRSFNYPTETGVAYRIRLKVPVFIQNVMGGLFETKSNIKIIEIGFSSSPVKIGNRAFYNQFNMERAVLNGVTDIGEEAFKYCGGLSDLTLSEGLKTIGARAFEDCNNLTSVTFYDTPDSIGSDVFNMCIKLTDIYVPWAEGAVAGAPWGAPATVHYNHTS